jgi:SAM-dependent methyltransferase
VASSNSEPPNPVRAPENSASGAPIKENIREFYDGISRRLGQSRVGDAAIFLNYGYVSLGSGDESQVDITRRYLNPTSIRLAFELVGPVDLRSRRVLDVGCGRGGTVALLADQFGADVTGVDLAPEAIAFCRRKHRQPNVHFEVGDAENLPVETGSFDVVTNIESSHIYPNLPGFYAEICRVLNANGIFLYTGVLSVRAWAETRAEFAALRLDLFGDRNITRNVLASCDAVAARHAKAYGGRDTLLDNFLAMPGSDVYEQMRSGAWEYRILRARRS